MKDAIGRRPSAEVMDDTVYPLKPFELSLYRNQTLHLFVSECKLSSRQLSFGALSAYIPTLPS